MTSTHPIPKLPVWRTTAEVFSVTARHLGDLVRFAWPWLLLLIAVSMTLYGAFFQSERAQSEAGVSTTSLWAITFLVSTILGALIAVPWHRRILLDEQQSLATSLSLDARKFAYIAKAVAIMASLSLPLVALTWAGSAAPSDDEAQTWLAGFASAATVFIFFVWMFALNCVSLILPATAVGNRDVTLARSWLGTRGNTLRLAFVSFVATFLPVVAPLALGYWLAPASLAEMDANTASSAMTYAIANTVWELISIFAGMLFVTFLSLSYRHFFGPSAIGAGSATHNATGAPDPAAR